MDPPTNPEPIEVHDLETLDLHDIAVAIDDDNSRTASPITPDERSHEQTPETPGLPDTPRRVTFRMSDGPSGTTGGNVMSKDTLEMILQYMQNDDSSGGGGPKIKEPDPYDGEDRAKLRPFLAQCELMFRAQPKKYRTDDQKIILAVSYTRNAVWNWAEPTIFGQH